MTAARSEPMPFQPVHSTKLKVLLSREQIARRVAEMGAQITQDFQQQSVTLVGVLKGACIFLSELARHIELDVNFDFISVSSYGAGSEHSGEVRLTKDIDHSIQSKNIILVEDILDTGLTLNYLKRVMLAHDPAVLKMAALLDKPARRIQPITVDYIGFEIPNEFVVGYGMDYGERYRNLPDICILPPELYQPL
jgi:hypoxanthine phosphoribosyltransferase